MNFLLSEEQLAFTDAIDSLLREECHPQHVHKIFDVEGAAQFDPVLWLKLVEMGIPAILVDEAYDGLGLEMIDLAIVAERLGAYAAPVPFLGHVLATLAISLGGSVEQKEKWLSRLTTGQILATVAFDEDKSRWDPASWQIDASAGCICGTKTMVLNAAEADLVIVGVKGGLVLVEKQGGYETTRMDSADRTRPIDTVAFDACPCEDLANVDDGVLTRLFDAAAVLLAADAFGGAEHCVKMSIEYAKMREQYGQAIANFQGLRYQLVSMALATEPSRGLYWYGAHAWDALPEKASHAASQAKAHLTDTYLQITRDTVEAHGGIGFTWEHDTHIYMKRAMLDWAWLGSPRLHRLRAADFAGW